MKKFYSTIFAVAFGAISSLAAWDGTSQQWTKGEGTEQSPYLIETEQHLAYLQEQVTAGESYNGVFFRLENDLDMSADAGFKILPIGFFDEYVNTEATDGSLIDESKYFLGTFDGNYKVIDNIHVEYVITDNSAVGGTGLFACLSYNSVVKNLGLGSRSIISGGELTGSLVGQMNGGLLQNCYSLATINSASTFGTGGLVAVTSNAAKIDKCYFGGQLSGNSDVGGIVGTAQHITQITNCYNKGGISAPNGYFVGGIVGSAYDSGTRIENCYNIGTIDAYKGFMSKPEAIVGDAEAGKVIVQNCYFLSDGTLQEATGVVEKTEEEMTNEAMITLLNVGTTAWEMDKNSQNGGFPVLNWQNEEHSGIAANIIENGKFRVEGNHIYLNNNLNEPVRVFVITGTLIYQGTSNHVELPDNGVYILRIGNYAAKVLVK